MAQQPAGGQMNHGTVVFQGPAPTAKSTNVEGAGLAKSSKSRLSKGFPNSPLLGSAEGEPSYTPDDVSSMQLKLISNSVSGRNDRSDAAGYWGFSAPKSDEFTPSSADMVFPAPNVSAVTTTGEDATPLASPYIPNLRPPAFGDADDNPDGEATKSFTASKTSRPPFAGPDLTNPSDTSTEIQTRPWRTKTNDS